MSYRVTLVAEGKVLFRMMDWSQGGLVAETEMRWHLHDLLMSVAHCTKIY